MPEAAQGTEGVQGASAAAVAAAAAKPNGAGDGAAAVAPVTIDWPTFVKTGVPEEYRKQAEQFKDPGSLFKSLNDTRAAAEKPWQPPKPDAPADVLSNFRKRMGVPETPEGYQFKHHKEGGEFNESDKAFQGKLAQAFHKHHLTPQQAEGLNGVWNEMVAAQEEAQVAADKQFAEENDAVIRKAWGKDYDAKKAMVQDYIKKTLAELGFKDEDLLNAQLKNGRFVGDYAPLMQVLEKAAQTFQQGGAPRVLSGEQKQSAQGRINEIHSWQHSKDPKERTKYRDDATQKELSDLYAQIHGSAPIVGADGRAV